jgi:hypothetical protein
VVVFLFVVAVVVVVVVVAWVIVAGGAAARKLKRQMSLETNGVRGRALVLSSSFLTTSTTINNVRYEQRTMTLDIDIPGFSSWPWRLLGAVDSRGRSGPLLRLADFETR